MSSIDKQVWDFLLARIGNEFGVSGLMGNLRAESGILPFRKQGDVGDPNYIASWQYTDKVNNNTITREEYINDSIGYGLAQWTFSSRKEGLYNYTRGVNVYVNNLRRQLDFLYYELENTYTGVLATLKNASSIREASDKVLHDFENPKVQTEAVEVERYNLSLAIYNTYHGSEPQPEPPEPVPTSISSSHLVVLSGAILEEI